MTTQSTVLKDATPANTITLENADGVFSVKKGEGSTTDLLVVDNTGVTTGLKDGSVTQTKLGTNVAGNGPAFRAYNSTTTSITPSMVKVDLQIEEFDTSSAFSSSRFTPQIAGYYQVDATMQMVSGNYSCRAAIAKNGTIIAYGPQAVGASVSVSASTLVYLNGITDYVELFGSSATTQGCASGAAITYMSGFLARAA